MYTTQPKNRDPFAKVFYITQGSEGTNAYIPQKNLSFFSKTICCDSWLLSQIRVQLSEVCFTETEWYITVLQLNIQITTHVTP